MVAVGGLVGDVDSDVVVAAVGNAFEAVVASVCIASGRKIAGKVRSKYGAFC